MSSVILSDISQKVISLHAIKSYNQLFPNDMDDLDFRPLSPEEITPEIKLKAENALNTPLSQLYNL